MARTYENSLGQQFATHAEAAASNSSLGTNPSTSNANQPSNNVIPSASLTPATPFNFPTPPTPPTPSNPAIQAGLNANTQAREQAQSQTKSTLQQSIQDIMGLNNEIGNVGNTVDRTAEDTARKEADRYTSEIEAEQLANRRAIENLQKNNPQGLFGGALQDEVNRIDRESLSKQADLAILQNSALRNYSTAKDIADREVQNKLEPLKIKLENLKFFYQENKELFNKEDDRLYNEKIKAEERAYNKEETLQNQIMALKLDGIKSGALNRGDLAKLNKAGSYEEMFNIVLDSWKNPTGPAEAPVVKTINGVDMQWNSSTRQWEAIGADGVDSSQNTKDQLSFLRQTAAKANDLSKASGVSGVGKFLGDTFVGDTKFRQLQSLTDTLRTNVLTLMTDPNIKKFFGPQMSEADVRLMTSAGTTLNPENNSPSQMRTEIKRLDNLFNRMQTAINSPAASTQTITAPDGRQIQIID